MIILILGVLFRTGRVLAECHGVHEPTPSGLHGLIDGLLCMRTRAVDIHTRQKCVWTSNNNHCNHCNHRTGSTRFVSHFVA